MYSGVMVSAFDLGLTLWAVQVWALAGDIALHPSLHPGVQIGTVKFNAGGNPGMD